jgi:hypothetical protein
MNDELERIWKEVAIDILSWHLLGRTEEYNNKLTYQCPS